ncbi:unnamed protein product [Lupinus luteus]|uniref:Uncharacterized protein n=1 Tax=Lupinus luteus TaxID=3873 RepID=A0AAV1WKS9_LUPLU
MKLWISRDNKTWISPVIVREVGTITTTWNIFKKPFNGVYQPWKPGSSASSLKHAVGLHVCLEPLPMNVADHNKSKVFT